MSSDVLISTERDDIVLRLARDLFETEERLDPGRYDCGWADLSESERAFHIELIWRILTRRSDLKRLLEDCENGV